jgi:ubiquinone/menaquinone biosynthesis C-methylase UbiE
MQRRLSSPSRDFLFFLIVFFFTMTYTLSATHDDVPSRRKNERRKERRPMATPQESRPEYSSTYVVQDRSNQQELTRMAIQDQLLTTSMGGALPEQPHPAPFQRVLDVGCGTGGWLIETALTAPTIAQLIGVDISGIMLDYAREQALTQHINERVEFHKMDALRMLEFPNAFFDLVNQRLGSSYLRSWDWRKLLQEYQRVLRPGGILRITEGDMVTESSSPAYIRFNQLVFQALNQGGHFLAPEPNGVTSQLARLLEQHGFQDIQSRPSQVEYHAGTPQGQRFFEDSLHAARTLLPFLQKWLHVPDDYEALCQQMLADMQQADFTATWRLLTVWGTYS